MVNALGFASFPARCNELADVGLNLFPLLASRNTTTGVTMTVTMTLSTQERIRLLELAADVATAAWEVVDLAKEMECYVLGKEAAPRETVADFETVNTTAN